MTDYIDTVICGDALEVLKTLPAGIVQTCVTSPPYYGLREYSTGQWESGDETCNHSPARKPNMSSTLGGGQSTNGHAKEGYKGSTCPKCGAIRVDKQIGLESTPDEYIANLVAVFREVWRVLKDDGIFWLNLGDSYCGYKGSNYGVNPENSNLQKNSAVAQAHNIGTPHTSGAKLKDLLMIPARVALALQADGWYLRSEIIWSKPNPMPESVKDRPTKSHEMIYLLAKQERYFYDAEAIKEPCAWDTDGLGTDARKDRQRSGAKHQATAKVNGILPRPFGGTSEARKNNDRRDYEYKGDTGLRNKRDVWAVNTEGYAGAHFATFPRDLILPCILAGSRLGDIVLDPFGGSGTTAKTALEFGRHYITIDLSTEYCEKIIRPRLLASNPSLFLPLNTAPLETIYADK